METFETIPKPWGNSLGVTIPKEIVEREHLSPKKKLIIFVLGEDRKRKLQEAFGTFACKTPTQQIMEEIDEGYDEH